MTGAIYAIITVLAWGTWLAPSQNVPLKNQQIRTFYVTLAVLIMSLLVAVVGGVGTLTARSFWLPFPWRPDLGGQRTVRVHWHKSLGYGQGYGHMVTFEHSGFHRLGHAAFW